MEKDNVLLKDSIVIPLDDYINTVRRNSRFNFGHVIVLVVYFAISYFLYTAEWKGSTSKPAPRAIFTIFVLTVSIIPLIPSSIKGSRKVLQIITQCDSNKLILDKEGIQIPAYILEQSTMKDIIAAGYYILKIKWEDITQWNLMRATKYRPSYYSLQIKNPIPTPNGEYVGREWINIKRTFLKKHENTLLSFAQKSLYVDIKKEKFWSMVPYYG